MPKIEKPKWWPDNPYPETIFPMKLERYLEIVPDLELRSALSGCLGRLFWDIASEAIWHRLKDAIEDGLIPSLNAIEMRVVEIHRYSPGGRAYVDLIPARLELSSTENSKGPTLQFKLNQIVKVSAI